MIKREMGKESSRMAENEIGRKDGGWPRWVWGYRSPVTGKEDREGRG